MCAGYAVCPAGGAAWLRLGRGAGAWGGVAGGGAPGREPCALAHARAAQESVPWVLTFSPYPGLLGPPRRSPHALPGPHLFQRDLQPLRPWRPREGIWARVPAGLGRGAGWAVPAETSASWGRVSSHSPNRVGSLGRGLGRGGSEREPCLSLRCRVEQMAGEGRGYVAGGGGVRGPADEEPRISTPRVSQERPPPHLFPERGRGRACLSPERLGLWPATDPASPSPAPGAPPTPRAPPPHNPALARPRGRGLWELPRLCG